MEDIQAGFNRPRPAQDEYITEQYRQIGIGGQPSLADIEPHATAMLGGGKLLEGMGLVLGRHIDAEEIATDAELRGIALAASRDPKNAFGALLLRTELEAILREQE